jgi:hypothetical protein
MKKMMMLGIAATMMLLGTMNMNAQGFRNNDRYNDCSRKEMKMDKKHYDRDDCYGRDDRVAMNDRYTYRHHTDRVYVINTIPERRPVVVYPVRRPRVVYRIHNNNGNVVAAAAAGVVIGSVLTTLIR